MFDILAIVTGTTQLVHVSVTRVVVSYRQQEVAAREATGWGQRRGLDRRLGGFQSLSALFPISLAASQVPLVSQRD